MLHKINAMHTHAHIQTHWKYSTKELDSRFKSTSFEWLYRQNYSGRVYYKWSDITVLCVNFRKKDLTNEMFKGFFVTREHGPPFTKLWDRYHTISRYLKAARCVGLESNVAFSQHCCRNVCKFESDTINNNNTWSRYFTTLCREFMSEWCPWEKPWWFQVTHQTSQWANLSRWLFWHGNDLLTITGIQASSC